MQSRRDQLQAYRFLVRRAVGAVVTGEPDVAESPMRRLTTTTMAGIMVAVLAATGVGLYGLIRPGASDAWKKPGAIIQDPQATLFIYQGGQLHEVANYATGALAVAGTGKTATLTHASNKALAGITRGDKIGDPGWPGDLPTKASALLTSPWTVCSSTVGSASDISESVDLQVGQQPTGTQVSAQNSVLVQTPTGAAPVLLWGGYKLTVKIQGLLPADLRATIVGADFLAAIPSWGIDLGPNSVPGTGTALPGETLPGLNPPGLKVGDLIRVQSATYVALKSGFAVAKDAVLGMLEAVPNITAHTATAAPPTLRVAPGTPLNLPGGGSAVNLVPVANSLSKVCASYAAKSGASGNAATGTWTTTISANANPVDIPSDQIADKSSGHIDKIGMKDNSAAIVTRIGTVGASIAQSRGIVTSDGFFGITDDKALTALGYQTAPVVALPPSLISVLRQGDPLDLARARCAETAVVSGGTC